MSTIRTLSLSLLGLLLLSCAGVDDGRSRRRDRDDAPPTATVHANREADRLVPDAEELLERAGYEISHGRRADYELELDLDAGPVNAIVKMTLLERGRTVAEAEGKAGGPRMIFDRSGVIRDAFDRCARELEIPRAERSRRW